MEIDKNFKAQMMILSDPENFKTPVKKKNNFINYARSKSLEKLIRVLIEKIQHFQSKIFLNLKLYSKLNRFISKIYKIFKISEFSNEFFSKLTFSEKKFEEILKRNSEKMNSNRGVIKIYNILEKKIIKSKYSSFMKITIFKPKLTLLKNSENINPLLEQFYRNKRNEKILRLEKKLYIKEEITRSRAYLKIIAYSKYLKHLSPFSSKNTTPIKNSVSPVDKYRPVSRPNPKLSYKYYPLLKMFAYISQNHLLCQAKSFKFWKILKFLENPSYFM